MKTFRGNQKRHIKKALRKAILKRSQLRNKASKSQKTIDVSNYTKQRNYVVKLNNYCNHFDMLNPEKGSERF